MQFGKTDSNLFGQLRSMYYFKSMRKLIALPHNLDMCKSLKKLFSGYDIEIEDQNGQVLEIPTEEKRSLTIALGLHEKGRAILKRKEYELALLLLLEADKEFETCRSEILSMVDNYAVLCLDIVWCYVCSKNISALPDAKLRLDSCEKAFKKSYGDSLQRLLAIKVTVLMSKA